MISVRVYATLTTNKQTKLFSLKLSGTSSQTVTSTNAPQKLPGTHEISPIDNFKLWVEAVLN